MSLRNRNIKRLQESQVDLIAPARLTPNQRINTDLQNLSNVLGVSSLDQPSPKKKSLRERKIKTLQDTQKNLNKNLKVLF